MIRISHWSTGVTGLSQCWAKFHVFYIYIYTWSRHVTFEKRLYRSKCSHVEYKNFYCSEWRFFFSPFLMCMNVLPTQICVPYVCLLPTEVRRIVSPGNRVTYIWLRAPMFAGNQTCVLCKSNKTPKARFLLTLTFTDLKTWKAQ